MQSQLATTSVARSFTVNDTPAINDLFISSVIADGNNGTGAAYNPTNPIAASLTKAGTGRLVLAGSSTYTSTTSITAGIVTMENSSALGLSLGNNVQAIAVNGAPTAGTFTVNFAGETSNLVSPTGIGTLAYNAPVLTVQSALQGLANTVAVTGGAGTFTLTFGGQTTPPIPFNAVVSGTTGSVQTVLQSLSSIGTTGVLVGGIPGDYTILFQVRCWARPLPR